jgi:hypothetical protein
MASDTPFVAVVKSENPLVVSVNEANAISRVVALKEEVEHPAGKKIVLMVQKRWYVTDYSLIS